MRPKISKPEIAVFVFNLNKEEELQEYEAILNDPNKTIYRDNLTTDRVGQQHITIWVEIEK